MKRFAKTIALSVLAVATGAGLFAGLATGERETSGKDHSKELEFIKIQPNKIKVEVDEKGKARFSRNRKVVVKYKAGPGAPMERLGKDKTNRKGIAKLNGSFFRGDYKAILKPKKRSRRAVHAREEDAIVEEEVDEDLDDDPTANAAGNRSGTFTTTTE